MKQHWWKIALGVVAALALTGWMLRSSEEESTDLLVQPAEGAFQVAVTATGELKAKNSVEIYGPRGTQQIRIFEMKIQRLVPEGTVVEKGQFVAELDRSELTSKIKDAELEMQKAQSQFTQARLDTTLELSQARDELVNLRYAMEEARLRFEQAKYEPPSVQRQAEIDYEKAERSYDRAVANYDTKVQQAEAKMQEVGAELSKKQKEMDDLVSVADAFTVMAPENGMVIYRRNWRGERTTAGSTVNAWDPVVATLPDLSTMESVTYVNEVDIQRVQPGQRVEIGLDAMADKLLTGTVTRVANIGEQRPNSDAKVFEVTIEVNEADSTLRPAMTTSNTIVVAERPTALRVPLESIHAQDSLNYVFVKRGRGAERQEVRLGLLNENEAVVEAGLEANDWVYLSLPADTSALALQRLPEADDPALTTADSR